MRRRFFVEHFEAGRATLHGDGAEHLARVLRAQPGQEYELSDGAAVWLGRVERVSRAAVEFVLLEELPAYQPKLRVALLLSIVKYDRFEWALEKATELGVAEIVPLAAERSDAGLVTAAGKRAARWGKILVESAQQARRLRPPELLPVCGSLQALGGGGGMQQPLAASGAAQGKAAPLQVLLSERRESTPLRSVVEGAGVHAATLAIGPEGGWTEKEFDAARRGGFVAASLGENVLRTETAVIAALACLNHALGERK